MIATWVSVIGKRLDRQVFERRRPRAARECASTTTVAAWYRSRSAAGFAGSLTVGNRRRPLVTAPAAAVLFGATVSSPRPLSRVTGELSCQQRCVLGNHLVADLGARGKSSPPVCYPATISDKWVCDPGPVCTNTTCCPLRSTMALLGTTSPPPRCRSSRALLRAFRQLIDGQGWRSRHAP